MLYYTSHLSHLGLTEMGTTSSDRARLAQYKDNIRSAVEAQFDDILEEVIMHSLWQLLCGCNDRLYSSIIHKLTMIMVNCGSLWESYLRTGYWLDFTLKQAEAEIGGNNLAREDRKEAFTHLSATLNQLLSKLDEAEKSMTLQVSSHSLQLLCVFE